MFPDLARDDVFRLETQRLWLRWPRISDAAESHNFAPNGRSPAIPRASPIPIRRLRRAVRLRRARSQRPGRDLTLVMTPNSAKSDAIGAISLESRGPTGLRWAMCWRLRSGATARHRGRRSHDRGGVHADAGGRDPGHRQGRERGLATRSWRSAGLRLSGGPARRPGARRLGRMPRFRLARADWVARASRARAAGSAHVSWRPRR